MISKFSIFRNIGFVFAFFLFASCLFQNTKEGVKTNILLTETKWKFDKVIYDLGILQNKDTLFGVGDTMVLGGETMLAFTEIIAASEDSLGLFSNERECFYGVKWENPGECTTDDLWQFQGDTLLVIIRGEAKCQNQGDSLSGSWFLNQEEKNLSIQVVGESQEFVISEITSSILLLSEIRTIITDCGENLFLKTDYSFSAF